MKQFDHSSLDKAPRLSIRIVIWILPSDTVFVNSIKISANTETAMLSRFYLKSTLSNHLTWVFLLQSLLDQLDVVVHVGQVMVGRLKVLHGLLPGALGLENPLQKVLVGQRPGVHQLFA